MSDASQGPGWWVAADGRWYPADQHPDPDHRQRWDASAPASPSPTPDPASAPAPVTVPDADSATAGATRPAGSQRRGPVLALVVVAVVVALVAGAAVVLTRSDGEGTVAAPGPTSATDGEAPVVLEAVGFAGADPFTDAMTVREVTEFPADVRAVIGGGPATTTGGGAPAGASPAVVRVGTEPGLYGGTRDEQACDPDQLVEFLAQQPAQAEAWAQAQRLPDAAAAGELIATLTPVVLTTDTLVTNHGFVDGRANPYPAVLQAGTAVLVDDQGVPRVKCSCGNPLAPVDGDPSIASTSGDAWAGFDTARVATVEAGEPVRALVVIDVAGGANLEQPVGAGAATGSGVAVGVFGDVYGGGSSIQVAADGMTGAWEAVHTTDVILHGVGYGDGAFVAVGARLGSGSDGTDSSQVLRGSADGRTWTEVGSIPGADIRDVAYAGGRWIAVGWSDPRDGQAVTFASDDGTTWTLLATLERPPEFGGATGFDSVATDGTTLVASLRGNAGARSNPHALYRSADGVTWAPTTAPISDSPAVVGSGDRMWLALGREALRSDDGATWVALPGGMAADGATAPPSPTRDDGWWYSATFTPPMSADDPGATVLQRSADGSVWEPVPGVTFASGVATDFALAT